jgi:hypothetical protein
MGLEEIGCDNVDWIQMAQHRVQWRFLVITAVNLRLLRNSENFITTLPTLSFSKTKFTPWNSCWLAHFTDYALWPIRILIIFINSESFVDIW